MKTNTVRKMMLAFMAVLMLCSAFGAAFAETEATAVPEGETESQTETQGSSDHRGAHRSRKGGKGRQDSFEDWFEDKIEDCEGQIDFSELPENPTDEEVMEFFSKYFCGQSSARTGDGKPKGHHGKSDDDDQYDWLEDWFEDKIDARKNSVDFSTLPENPTDDEILEFFRTNFLNEEPEKPAEENAEDAAVQPEAPDTPETEEPAEEGSGETA